MTPFATTRHLLVAFLLLMLPALAQAQAVHDTGTIEFEVFANGFIGTTPANNYSETGFTFNGDPGLFHAAFVAGVSETQVSGNYYGAGTNTVEFSTVSGPTALTPPFDEPFVTFDQGFEAVYDDSAAPNPIGLRITQRSYTSSDDPNDTFAIMEFEIENTSGSDVTGLHAGIFADWDIGGNAFDQNLAGYDEGTRLLFNFDDTGATGNYFGVASLGNVNVSGINYDALGGSETDFEIWQFLTTIVPEPVLGEDRRSTLGVGPLDITDGESVTVRFAFVGGANESDIIRNAAIAQSFFAEPIKQAIHETDSVEFEVYADGHIGAFADAASASVGTGFVYEGDNGLYEGQLLVGASATQVSGEPYSIPQSGSVEWQLVDPMVVAGPPQDFDQAFRGAFDDGSAPNPIGVTVSQYSYSNSGDDFVTMEFTVANTSGGNLEDIYVGVFMDWDVGTGNAFQQNLGGYDEENRLLYIFDDSQTVTSYYGQVALGDDPVSGVFYDALPGDDVLYQALTTIAPDPPLVEDRRTVLGMGPYTIADGEEVTVSFAIVGGDDLDDIITNACLAQGGDDATCNPVSIEETTPAGTFTLHSAYPNPFASRTTLGFTLPEAQHVRLTVYDVLGRRVATLADGPQAAGYSEVVFDAATLPGGVYVYRLETDSVDLTERVSLVR